MLQIHHIDTATHLVRIGLLCFTSNALPTHYNQLPSRFRPSKSEHIKTYNIQISPFSISFVPWWQPHLTRNTPFLYLTQERPNERIRATASFLFSFYFVDILFPPQRYHSYFSTQYTSLLLLPSYRSAFVCTCCPNNIFLSPIFVLSGRIDDVLLYCSFHTSCLGHITSLPRYYIVSQRLSKQVCQRPSADRSWRTSGARRRHGFNLQEKQGACWQKK